MIQRIQTIYLLISAIILALVFKVNFAFFNTINGIWEFKYFGIINISTNEIILKNYMFYVLPIGAISLCVISIFLFKNRKIQLKISLYALYLLLFYIVLIAYYIYKVSEMHAPHYQIALLFPVISIILIILARMAIKKDDDLVKSIDRIR